MRIGEVISKSGLSKKTIHFYIQEELISPQKEENGYYDFSDQDLLQLETIKKMRYLGLSVDSIRLVLQDPSVAFYYFIKQRKAMEQELKELQWKNESISEMIECLNTGMSYDALAETLDEKVKYYPEDHNSKVIDINDAELLAYFFWGRFVGKVELTEYQKFLWEKLKKTIVLTQVESTSRLRDTLYQFKKDHIEEEFYCYCDEKLAMEIASLSVNEIAGFVDKLVLRAREHLSNPTWVRKWKKNQRYIIDTGYFFASEPSVIMCEMSSFFKCYKTNINQCGTVLWEYVTKGQGKELLALISNVLAEELDLYSHNYATLIGICLWD